MNQENDRDEMRQEYDIRGGVRGKYYARYMESRVSVRAAPTVTIETSSSTASIGMHQAESTLDLFAQPNYQPREPVTR